MRRLLYNEWITYELQPNVRMNMQKVIEALQEQTPNNAIITNDAGNFCGWLHRFYQFKKP
jgi:acetolactate synthase-1/2/3 large subunit